jgi:hypothetical protein
MTATERDRIEKLGEKVDGYHTDVARLLEKHSACRQEVLANIDRLNADMYGVEGQREEHPGAMNMILSQAEWRDRVEKKLGRIGRGVWTLCATLAGAALTGLLALWRS